MRLVYQPLAVAVLAACAFNVHATISGTATLSNLQIQLVDLTPNDGATTYLRPYDAYSAAIQPAQASAWVGIDSNDAEGEKYSAPVGTALAAASHAGGSVAQAQTTAGNPFGTGVLPSASANLVVQPGAHAQADGALFNPGWTYLSPHTKLVLRADASVNASWSDSAGNLSFSSSLEIVDALHAYSWNPGLYSASRISRWGNTIENNLRDHLFVYFVNDSDREVVVYTHAGAYAYVDMGPPPPVPEPSTTALSLAGLGLLGGVLRLKRRSRR